MSSGITSGSSYPLGATICDGGVNFSVFSKNCKAMELLLFDDPDDSRPSRIIHLDPKRNKSFYYWHVFVEGLEEQQLYGYRAHGPYAPDKGYRYDGDKVLLDPYVKSVAIGKGYDREAAIRPGDNCARTGAGSGLGLERRRSVGRKAGLAPGCELCPGSPYSGRRLVRRVPRADRVRNGQFQLLCKWGLSRSRVGRDGPGSPVCPPR